MIGDERFYSSIVQPEDRRRDPARRSSRTCRCTRRRIWWCTWTCSAWWRTRRSASACRSTSRVRPSPRASRAQGGVVSHMRTDVEVSCLPKDLPEFLELDLSAMNLNDTKFLADMPLPTGVTIPELTRRNAPVVSIHARAPRSPSRWPPRPPPWQPRVRRPQPRVRRALQEPRAQRLPQERRVPRALPVRRPPPGRARLRRARRRRKALPPRRRAARSSRRRLARYRTCAGRGGECASCRGRWHLALLKSTTWQVSRSS